MKKPLLKSLMVGMALCFVGTTAQASEANFKADINAAIDDGLAYSRANNHFTVYTEANGLSLLTLLEKETIPAGYDGLTVPGDKILAQNAACILIDSSGFGDRAGFYSYYDGQVLMGLSVYLDTGGPDEPAFVAPHNCAGRSARATIDKVVDRALAAQTPGTPAAGNCAGYWGYSGNGCDSSTTQFTLAGLASAKGFYSAKGESADKARIPLITAALNKTSDGYAANGQQQAAPTYPIFNTCGTQGCFGHGYQATYGPGSNTSQQTASGTWGQLVGSGKTANNLSIQRYLHWLQNAYNYNNNAYQTGAAYFYYLWSSSKAYNIIEIEQLNQLPVPGNIYPKDLGALPALVAGGITRLANQDPNVVTRPPRRGADIPANYYAGAPEGWYFDYAYKLMSLQTAAGQFPNPNGSWDPEVDHAYAILVLQRSLGGACPDSDGDEICDSIDNCISTPNNDQANNDKDKFGNVCDNCPNTPNDDQKDSNNNGIGDACEGSYLLVCDVNNNNQIDRTDLSLISKARNKVVIPPGADHSGDADRDGKITPNDVKVCIANM